VDFIAYEPPLPADVPTETPPNLGLRTSADIPIPRNSDGQGSDSDKAPNPQASHHAPNPCLQPNEDVEVTRAIERIRMEERESNIEQDEYEAAILQRLGKTDMEAAEILTEMRQGDARGNIGADGMSGLANATDAPFMGCVVDDVSVCNSHGSIRTRTNPSRASQGSSRRSTPLPAQSNTLLSWLQFPPENPSTNRSLSELAVQKSPSIILPSPPHHPVCPSSPNPTRPTTQITPPRRGSTTSPDPSERTALRLATQLRHFQGCTYEQHDEADGLHQEHHQRPDVHSACSSLREITMLLRGDDGEGTPLPDVLGNPKLMKPADLRDVNCRSAFEGTSPEDIGTPDENLPRNLCLAQHHASSNKNRTAHTTFDIDSICCFPTSLGIARQGINWFPKPHSFLNFGGDVHFSLKVPTYDRHGDLAERYIPLHKVPHYCFGSLIGMESLFIYIFFPALHLESDYEHTTYLSSQDQQLWYDAALSPALKETIGCSNILQHYPASAHITNLDSTALSTESLARKESAREQLLRYALQPQHLDPLWNRILESIADNPGLGRFEGATLFMNAKNTKLEHMDASLTAAYGRWGECWSRVTDPQFHNKDRTFVDLGKQVTSEDSALPYDRLPDSHEAEVFLWRKCCLDAYARTREVFNPNGSRAKGNPRRTTYPWATMRDTMGQTLFSLPRGKESVDGLIYSQFYGLIKTPFDTSKAYVFHNESLENLALDPGYIRSLQQEGSGVSFSKAVCEFAYLHSKKRAHANLTDNRWKSYGIREEHRVSLGMMEEICEQWRQWDLYDDSIDDIDSPLPYYVAPTRELLGFLYAQINKHCLLFESTLAHTARTYSLPETMVMVVALRALRFCYGSNLIQQESLLYKNRWEQTRGQKTTIKEGLGMRETMERCGIGWFLPKFNWATWRLAPPHGDNMLVGNLLMHKEYKRRWQAVKDLRDVYVRFNQAEAWYDQYRIGRNPGLLGKWLEYLHALNLEQFDADVWRATLTANRRSPELTPEAIQRDGEVEYCYWGMKEMFLVDGAVGMPHLVTGNKMRFERVADLLSFLFLWDDGQERLGWGEKPYRVIVRKSFELIELRLGYRKAERWFDEFLHLIRLTHWILPYPSNTALIAATKTSRERGLKRRMMWFSAVYAHPDKVELPFQSMPSTLYRVIWNAQRQLLGGDRCGERLLWGTSQLISACRAQGVHIYGLEEENEYWVVGKRSIGVKGFRPVWERARPPRLKMLGQIKGKSLDELDELMVEFARDQSGENEEVDNVGGREVRGGNCEGEASSIQHAPTLRKRKRSIREVFTRLAGARGDGRRSLISGDGSSSSGSIFVPSR
jgi:hypothetical protein